MIDTVETFIVSASPLRVRSGVYNRDQLKFECVVLVLRLP